jgi:O-antigen ligase
MRRLAKALMLVFAFAIPWEYSLEFGPPFGNIARLIGVALLMVMVPAVLREGRIRTPGPLQLLVLAFFVWLCCSCFWTIEPADTLRTLRGNFQELIIVWLLWELVETPYDIRNVLRAYVAGAWVLAALTVLSFVFRASPDQIRFVAEGQDPNDVARFLDLGLPMAALLLGSESRWPGKFLAAGYMPVGLFGVLLTASRSGFLAALVALAGCALVLYRNHPRTVAGAALASPIAVAAIWLAIPQATLERLASIPQQFESVDLNQRWDIWAAGWQAFVRAPFFGSGTGTFVSAAALAPIDTAHNTVLALAVEGGVLSVVLAGAIVVTGAILAMKPPGPVRLALGACLVTLLVASFVATVQENRTTWLLLGLIAVAARIADEDPEGMSRSFPTRLWNEHSGSLAESKAQGVL